MRMVNSLDYREHGNPDKQDLIQPVNPADLVGLKILRAHLSGGDYGMGSAGIASWLLDKPEPQWLRLGLWGCAEWLHANNTILINDDPAFSQVPLMTSNVASTDEYKELFDEHPRILSFTIEKHAFRLQTETCLIELKADPYSRPRRSRFMHNPDGQSAGPDRELLAFQLAEEVDLRTVFVLSGNEWDGEDEWKTIEYIMRKAYRRDSKT